MKKKGMPQMTEADYRTFIDLEQREGASGVSVINPAAETMGDLCRTFESVEAGAEYLQFLRAR